MKQKYFYLLLVLISLNCFSQAVVLSEEFDDITTLTTNNWIMTNQSSPIGATGWSQGVADGVFTQYSGTDFISTNFNNTAGTGTISNWLITPMVQLSNGSEIKFYTRTTVGTYPDRLEVRLSTNGNSSVIPSSGANDLGDFTTLLLTINPSLTTTGYPETWTEYTATISGLSGPTNCKAALRYYVTNGGPSGLNSDYIGIDNFSITNPPATHLNFDGVNDNVSLPATAINNLTQGTIEVWVYPTASILENQTICAKQSNNENTYAYLSIGGGGKVNYQSTNGSAIQSISTIISNQWTHIAVAFTSTQAKIYINGILDKTVSGSFSLPNDTTVTATTIGAILGDGNGQYFTGSIDEFRIWNIARTAEQIAGSMNCELQGTETELVSYYQFNQGIDQANNAGVTTLNATIGSNGTLTNFTLTSTTSNWLAGSPVTTGSVVPENASATSPIVYNQGDTASALSATTGTNGTGLMWYTTATGGTGSTTAPTPSTATAGSTSYWVASTNANGCESERVEIVVNVTVANDECANAIALTVGTSSFNDFPENVLLTTATNSGAPTPTCGNFQGGDIWYTATVPASGNIVIETDGTGVYDTGLEVYTGSCGTFALVACDDASGNGDYSKIMLLGQTPGTVLYIRVWEDFFGISNAQFQISAYDYVVPATHLNFDGVNDFVVSTNAISSNTQTQSYQAWIRIPSIPVNDDRFLQRGNDATGGWSVSLSVNSTGKVYAGFSSVGYADTYLTSTTTLVPNTWYQATFVFENNNSIRLYIDGNLEANTSIGNRTLRNSDNKLRIGSGNIAAEYFKGDIDEVRVWNTALTDADILVTKDCELQSSQTGLLAYYKFNQGFDLINNASVTTLLDEFGSNNGTLTNFALTGVTSNWLAGSVITTGNACATLGNSSFESVSNFKVFPNPSNGLYNISTTEQTSVSIYDLVGKLIMNTEINTGTSTINIYNLPAGVYFLNYIGKENNTNGTIKLIKN